MELYIMYIVFAILILISIFIEIKIGYVMKKFNIKSNKSGFEVARNITDTHNLKDLYIVKNSNLNTNYYDSNRKVIKLNKKLFDNEDIGTCVIVSNIAFTAVESQENNFFAKLKNVLKQIENIWIIIAYIFMAIGTIIGDKYVLIIGIILFVLLYLLYFSLLNFEKNINIDVYKFLKKEKLLPTKDLENIKNDIGVFDYDLLKKPIGLFVDMINQIKE